MKFSTSAVALLGAGSIAHAAIVKSCPKTNVCYSLNIPDATAQSGTGDIYFQISAPTSYQWVALGQGTTMPGSNIFMIYSSADGQNVTLSPRLATGFFMPQHDTSADVTLLAGSGISNGMMTANIKCSNCNKWSGGSMDFTSSSASWVYAYKSGSALDSDDPAEGVTQHDDAEPFTFDLTVAKGGSDTNPFVATATTSGDPASSSTPATVVTQTPSSSGKSGALSKMDKIRAAHGYLASTAFLILFPIGAVLIRLGNFSNAVWAHVAVQVLAYALFTAAFGLGVYMVSDIYSASMAHPIIGIVIFVLLFTQPLSGWVHHRQFVKLGRRTLPSWLHLGVGRVAIVVGIANGFVGLDWADEASMAERHAYLALAVIALVVYVSAIVYGEFTRARKMRNGNAAHVPSGSNGETKAESLSS